MTRKALIFGNGLGMALDHEHFNLTNAINYIWGHEDILSDDDRRYIETCLPGVDGRPPEGEHEWGVLHLAVTACGFLRRLSGNDVEWLSEQGRLFPDTISMFVHKVATKLHNYEGEGLPEGFIQPLCAFLKDTKSHVATLNYDRLLYGAMIDNGVLDGFNYLVDGMWDAGFHRDNLERLYERDFGYYLHLHGSPLFVNRNGSPTKKQRHQLSINSDFIGRHIVLTHVDYKMSVISSSPVLLAYWEYLDYALGEAEEIVVFGCSGDDEHLNHKLKAYGSAPAKSIRVIEWTGAGDHAARRRFWRRKLGDKVQLTQLDNILEFADW